MGHGEGGKQSGQLVRAITNAGGVPLVGGVQTSRRSWEARRLNGGSDGGCFSHLVRRRLPRISRQWQQERRAGLHSLRAHRWHHCVASSIASAWPSAKAGFWHSQRILHLDALCAASHPQHTLSFCSCAVYFLAGMDEDVDNRRAFAAQSADDHQRHQSEPARAEMRARWLAAALLAAAPCLRAHHGSKRLLLVTRMQNHMHPLTLERNKRTPLFQPPQTVPPCNNFANCLKITEI